MQATVVLAGGPRSMQLEPIANSVDGLARIVAFAGDRYMNDIVARIPDRDAYFPIGKTTDLTSPTFPVGKVRSELNRLIADLRPEAALYNTGRPCRLTPGRMALAMYLGFVTDANVEAAMFRGIQQDKAEEPESLRRERERQDRERAEAGRLVQEIWDGYRGFLNGKTPMQISKIRDALERQSVFNGVVMSRKAFIEKAVVDGYQVLNDSRGRRFEGPNGSYFRQADVTKTALDYAEFLISKR